MTEAQSWIAKFQAGLTTIERAEAMEEISLRRAVEQSCRVTHYTFTDGSELVVRRGERPHYPRPPGRVARRGSEGDGAHQEAARQMDF